MEITYYVKRNTGLMAWVSAVLVIGQFFLPFLLLCLLPATRSCPEAWTFAPIRS